MDSRPFNLGGRVWVAAMYLDQQAIPRGSGVPVDLLIDELGVAVYHVGVRHGVRARSSADAGPVMS